ncbi:MAG: hypothetical protein ACE14T_00420 [Syntrophales bacterium]
MTIVIDSYSAKNVRTGKNKSSPDTRESAGEKGGLENKSLPPPGQFCDSIELKSSSPGAAPEPKGIPVIDDFKTAGKAVDSTCGMIRQEPDKAQSAQANISASNALNLIKQK